MLKAIQFSGRKTKPFDGKKRKEKKIQCTFRVLHEKYCLGKIYLKKRSIKNCWE